MKCTIVAIASVLAFAGMSQHKAQGMPQGYIPPTPKEREEALRAMGEPEPMYYPGTDIPIAQGEDYYGRPDADARRLQDFQQIQAGANAINKDVKAAHAASQAQEKPPRAFSTMTAPATAAAITEPSPVPKPKGSDKAQANSAVQPKGSGSAKATKPNSPSAQKSPPQQSSPPAAKSSGSKSGSSGSSKGKL